MSPVARLLAGLVRAYQLMVSPWVTVSCRYYPSCSAYALEAVQRHGAVRGTGLAVRRLLRCHPWARGGVDHVPGHESSTAPTAPTAPAALTAPTAESRSPTVLSSARRGTPTEPART